MFDVELPCAVEIEKKLLSALWIKEGRAIPEVMEIIQAEDFYRPMHRMIYAATIAVYESGTIPDYLLVEAELEKRGELKKVGRLELFSLVELEYSTARAKKYAQTIREMSQRRRLIYLSDEIMVDASKCQKPVEELVERMEREAALLNDAEKKDAVYLPKALPDLHDEISARAKNNGELLGVRTGFYDLDYKLGGLKKSDLIILAARPSMGKTALALNIAKAASLKAPVLVFSLEMSTPQLLMRLASTESRVNCTKLINGDLTKNDWYDFFASLERLEQCQMYIDDTGGQSLAAIKMRAKQHQRKYGLGLIVIDYLQLMHVANKENRVQEVSEISRGLKALAKELDVPILALSQLNRGVEMRADKRPQLSDLRESGSIEQDADIVMFLYRDEYYNRDSEDNNIAELIIAKNRNGATGITPLYFEAECLRFSNLTRRET